MPLLPPILSEFDPVSESEGSIDPLGLQAVYERLADRILPAITVRMARPRFVTAIAVGAHVCSTFDDETLAADEVTPPWLVFEWFVVEALVRSLDQLSDPRGIAGILKVARALQAHGYLNAASYLKTPKVFGFTGIYKRLAIAAKVTSDDLRLDQDVGFSLVKAWEQDQGLEGFLSSDRGAGARFRESLRGAIRQGLEKGHTTAQSKDFWSLLATSLEPGKRVRSETKVLYEAIQSGDGHGRNTSELIAALEAEGKVVSRHEEAPFLRRHVPRASEGLRAAIEAIDRYEQLCRPVSDAFDRILTLSSQTNGGSVSPDDFARTRDVDDLVRKTRQGVAATTECAHLLDWEPAVRDLIDAFRDADAPVALFRMTVARHEAAQKAKPPDGKRPWLERVRGDRIVVRPGYARVPSEDVFPPYVHEYRTPTLSGFLEDLGRLS